MTEPGAFFTSTIYEIDLLSPSPTVKSIMALILDTSVLSCCKRDSMSSKNLPDLCWLVVAVRLDDDDDDDGDEPLLGAAEAFLGKPSV